MDSHLESLPRISSNPSRQYPEIRWGTLEIIEIQSICWRRDLQIRGVAPLDPLLYLFFVFQFFEDASPFCGAADTPVLDFW